MTRSVVPRLVLQGPTPAVESVYQVVTEEPVTVREEDVGWEEAEVFELQRDHYPFGTCQARGTEFSRTC